ncbi:MAG: hypothetical protein WD749_02415 [Phycisphaerales bacterium]
MKSVPLFGVCAALSMGGAAFGAPTLQFDVNAIQFQTTNSVGGNSAFGGLSHTGTINFSFNSTFTNLAAINVQSAQFGPWIDQGFSGSLSGFTGSISLVNGGVTGGSIFLAVNGNTDSYSCQVVPNVGTVQNYVSGGYTIQGLTFNGLFSDAMFGNVDVSQWFSTNGALFGSYIEFNFNPDPQGFGFADMDLFVDAVPLPPGVWAGVGMLSGLAVLRVARRRR